jgi:hypothetical protein
VQCNTNWAADVDGLKAEVPKYVVEGDRRPKGNGPGLMSGPFRGWLHADALRCLFPGITSSPAARMRTMAWSIKSASISCKTSSDGMTPGRLSEAYALIVANGSFR